MNTDRKHFGITQQAVSQHLKVLREVGPVEAHADRQRRLCAVRPEGLRSIEVFLSELWPASLQRLKAAVESNLQLAVKRATADRDTRSPVLTLMRA